MCEIRVTKEHNIKPNVETKPKMRTKTRLEYTIRNNRMRARKRQRIFHGTKYLYNI